ncbi:MAG TPA: hypothetical protein VLF59_04985 [Candidatus Saccharimonadales bacterium]|nr:hypothetical protein [Candidatus Saccharimonadales bacterium]
MQEGVNDKNLADSKQSISLYEFYAIGINHLIEKAPWELVQAVSAYHGNFLTEQRCIGLSILLLMGEEHVPASAAESMPKYAQQVRASVNQATFLRALKHYFVSHTIEEARAALVLERMQSYLTESRAAEAGNQDPLLAMTDVLTKRVPPKDTQQGALYMQRIEKIFQYLQDLVENTLLARYTIIVKSY